MSPDESLLTAHSSSAGGASGGSGVPGGDVLPSPTPSFWRLWFGDEEGRIGFGVSSSLERSELKSEEGGSEREDSLSAMLLAVEREDGEKALRRGVGAWGY